MEFVDFTSLVIRLFKNFEGNIVLCEEMFPKGITCLIALVHLKPNHSFLLYKSCPHQS